MRNKKERPSQSQTLCAIVQAQAGLFHDDEAAVFAGIPENGHFEFHPVRSSGFTRWLRNKFYLLEGKPPSAQALNDALGTVEGIGQFQGDKTKTYVRIGEIYGTVCLDLCDEFWRAIGINDKEFGTHNFSPVHFIRSKGMLPLPEPRAGSVEELRPFLNLPDENSFILIVSWLVGALRPKGPYPILVLNGEQGSSKSTLSRLLKSLIDPSASCFRSYPRNERDVVISASNSWVLIFDNLSAIQPWFSEALCRISTGGGYITRELYTNKEETIFTATRPIILNGITDIVHRHDLSDRCIFITMPPIKDESRLTEDALNRKFEEARPGILGGLLSAVSVALKNYKSITLPSLPRMADFAKWIVASEAALPWSPGAFLDAYNENRKGAYTSALDSDIFAVAFREWFEGQEQWTGTASDLIQIIERDQDDKLLKHQAWPKDATRVSTRLRRLSGFLRRLGIDVEFPDRSGKSRKLTIKKVAQSSVTSVTSVIPEGEQDVPSDAECDADDTEGFSSVTKKPSDFSGGDADDADDAKKHTFLFCKGYGRRIAETSCEWHQAKNDPKCKCCEHHLGKVGVAGKALKFEEKKTGATALQPEI